MIRALDLCFAFFGLLLWVIGWLDTGSPLFLQMRVGRQQKPFVLIKFRTMQPDTASVATHLADVSASTPLGAFLRRNKPSQHCPIIFKKID